MEAVAAGWACVPNGVLKLDEPNAPAAGAEVDPPNEKPLAVILGAANAPNGLVEAVLAEEEDVPAPNPKLDPEAPKAEVVAGGVEAPKPNGEGDAAYKSRQVRQARQGVKMHL